MKRPAPARALAVAAGAVIIALTVAAFWLSYAHLAEVALAHGLGTASERAWAWPATLDLFIVAGELLMLRAALLHRVDPWAIGLTVAGSGGSIALNVAGVGTHAGTLDYVVAAVPPTAALLAFGALMRQVHQALATRAEVTAEVVVNTVVDPVAVSGEHPAVHTVSTPVPVNALHTVEPPAVEAVPVTEPLVICGVPRVFTLSVPPVPDPPKVAVRLSAEQAREVIEAGWVNGAGVRETARLSTRSASYVAKVFTQLTKGEAEAAAVPLALVAAEKAA
ncbi:DUF2637 domain-containing protein [Streptomyces sp. NPDC006976]|uniref:DUF2637 domain-containing protein n=1 Tax=Streptomyces sp. NPDC006976 TaxID=3154311 RepID=UPI0033C53C7A